MPSGSGECHRVLLLGAGELGKELARAARRLGFEVAAADRYADAPAMHEADRRYVIELASPAEVRRLVEREQPHYIVPELEDLAAFELERLEQEGWRVVPSARAARLTMDREGIRRLAAEELQMPTSRYFFANSLFSYKLAATVLGFPHVVKPTRSSRGRGHTLVRRPGDMNDAWQAGVSTPRTRTGRIIVEEHVAFDHEFTLLAVRHRGGVAFCPPIGHAQGPAGFAESWQPHHVPEGLLARAREIARRVADALDGHGVFGIEFLVKDDELYFSEVSCGPHDTGFVTLRTQAQSQFELHLRAMAGELIEAPALVTPGACAVILSDVDASAPAYDGLDAARRDPDVHAEIFGKPAAWPNRRMGVTLATARAATEARLKATRAAQAIRVRATPPALLLAPAEPEPAAAGRAP